MPALNTNTQYCHLVDRQDSDSLIVPGSLTVTGAITSATSGAVSATSLEVTGGGDVTLTAASNVILDATTGTKIGTATSQKLGFYNATPVVQQAAVTAVDALTGGESPTEAEHNLAVAAINDLITKLENLGFLAAN